MLAREATQPLEKTGRRWHDAHVAGDGLNDQGGDLPRPARHRGFDLGQRVVSRHHRVAGGTDGDARRSRDTERRYARSGLDEQRIRVPVVATRELDQLVAAGRRSRKPHGGHGGLGS